jgi:lysophospholipase L1-like esterase
MRIVNRAFCGLNFHVMPTAILFFMTFIGMSIAGETRGYTIHNKGVGGNTTKDALSRYDGDVRAFSPQALIIFFGMNDAVNDAKAVPLEQFRLNLQEIVRLGKEGSSKMALITINPVFEEPLYARHPKNVDSFYLARGGANAIIRDYNEVIRKVAAEQSVPLLDYNQTILGSPGSSIDRFVCPDGVHPTSEGMKAIARLAADFLRKELPAGGTVVCFGDSITMNGYPATLDRLLQ